MGSIAQASIIEEGCQYEADSVLLVICIDEEIRELDMLRSHIQNQIFSRIEFKYAKKLPDKTKALRSKLENSIIIWDKYRTSYCDLETINITDEQDRLSFIQDCLVNLTKTRIEDLRLLQINI